MMSSCSCTPGCDDPTPLCTRPSASSSHAPPTLRSSSAANMIHAARAGWCSIYEKIATNIPPCGLMQRCIYIVQLPAN